MAVAGKVLLAAIGVTLAMGVASAAPMGLAIKSASAQADTFSGAPTLVVELQPSAQRAFTKLTTRHVGETLNLLIDGAVVSSPRIQSPIVGTSVVISGDFTPSEATALAQRLSNGESVVEVDLAAP
jgi:preprotein translocase subunit SecD